MSQVEKGQFKNSQGRHEHNTIEDGRANDRSLFDVLPLQEWDWGEVLLPDEEGGE